MAEQFRLVNYYVIYPDGMEFICDMTTQLDAGSWCRTSLWIWLFFSSYISLFNDFTHVQPMVLAHYLHIYEHIYIYIYVHTYRSYTLMYIQYGQHGFSPSHCQHTYI